MQIDDRLERSRTRVKQHRMLMDGINHASQNPDLPITDQAVGRGYIMSLVGQRPPPPSIFDYLLSLIPHRCRRDLQQIMTPVL